LERLPEEKSEESGEESLAPSHQKQASAAVSRCECSRRSAIDCKDGRVEGRGFQASWPVLAGAGDCKDGRVKDFFASGFSTLALIAKMDFIGLRGQMC
jgi:hypothetical protein